MDILSLVQWPAMVVTIVASYLVGSGSKGRRSAGFWLFLASNVLWVVWGWHAGAYALIALQFALLAMNVRGARRNASEDRERGSDRPFVRDTASSVRPADFPAD